MRKIRKIPCQELNNTLNVGIYPAKKEDTKNYVNDTKRYGENIPSQFNWVSFEEQKKRAKKLEREIKS